MLKQITQIIMLIWLPFVVFDKKNK